MCQTEILGDIQGGGAAPAAERSGSGGAAERQRSELHVSRQRCSLAVADRSRGAWRVPR